MTMHTMGGHVMLLTFILKNYSTRQKNGDILVPFRSVKMETRSTRVQLLETVNSVH